MTSKPATKSAPKRIPAPKAAAVADVIPPGAVLADGAMEQDVSPAAGRGTALKLRELVNRVAEATGGKKKGVKEIVEATLAQLGAALDKGEELNLPGVGKVRVARLADKDGRSMMTLKVRGIGTPRKKEQTEALAEADEAV